MNLEGRVLSVGSSIQAAGPVLKSLSTDRPPNVLFAVSSGPDGSLNTLENYILPNLPAEYRPEYELITLSDPENVVGTYEQVRGRVREWIDRRELRPDRVDVDFTGGTKVMSVVLGLVAVEEGVDTVYVGGLREEGTVVTGLEEVVRLPNPYREFAVRELADAELLLNGFHADAAAQVLSSGIEICARVHRDTLAVYQKLAECLAAADLFQFGGKLGAPRRFDDNSDLLEVVLDEELYREMDALNRHWTTVRRQVAASEHQGQPAGRETLVEILANAERRAAQSRYDDAVGRLYRAIELHGQQLLAEAYGGNLSEVPISGLRDKELVRFDVSDFHRSDGIYRIRGLRALYQALAFSESEKYQDAKRAFDRLNEYLEYRNESYMAHGLIPITEDKFTNFWNATLSFLGIDESDIPRWPSVSFTL